MAVGGAARCLAALLVLGLAAAGDDRTEVHVLTDGNFDETVAEGFWLVELYAPWCGHCKRLNPILDEMAPEALELHGMHIGKVDATVHSKLGEKLDVKGYPSLRFRMNPTEDWRKYEGGRSKQDLLGFADRMNGPTLQPVASVQDLQAFYTRLNSSSGVFVAGEAGSDLETTAAAVAADLKHKAYFAKGPTSVLGGDLPPAPFVAVVEQGEVPRLYKSDNHTAEALKMWVDNNNHPLVNELGSHNFRALGKKGKLVAFGVVDPDAPSTPAFLEGLGAVARSFAASSEVTMVEEQEVALADRFVFGHLDGVKWKDFVVQFDVFGELPKVVVLNMPAEIFYTDPEVNEPDELETFLREVFEGKAPARREGMKSTMSRMWRKVKNMGPYSVFMLLPVLLLVLAYVTSPKEELYTSPVDRLAAETKAPGKQKDE